MKSRITIEVDFEKGNRPFLQVLRRQSSDVRDSLISQFIQDLGHDSTWCSIQYDNEFEDEIGKVQRWKIKPITRNQLTDELKLMKALVANDTKENVKVHYSRDRRVRLDLMEPAERAIHNAIMEIEKMGGHTLLTNAQLLLSEAFEMVADYIDSKK